LLRKYLRTTSKKGRKKEREIEGVISIGSI